MSEVKVNKVSPRTGTELELGDSGDTIKTSGSLDTNNNNIITASNRDLNLYPNGTGAVEIGGNTNPGTIILNCESNSHGIKLQSPAHSAGQSYTLKFPTDNVTADRFLKVASITGSGTSAVGQLSFAEAGGGNAPYFEAYSAGDEDVSDSTITKATLGTEAQDSDGKFASSRFTPTVAGRYYIEGQVFGGSANGQGDVAAVKTLIYFNGSAYKSSSVHNENSSSEKNGNQCVPVSAIITFDTDDYVELYGYVDKGSSQAKFFAGTKSTYLLGYKIG